MIRCQIVISSGCERPESGVYFADVLDARGRRNTAKHTKTGTTMIRINPRESKSGFRSARPTGS
jgi:hypothetical protein